MAQEITTAREGSVNPINAIRGGRTDTAHGRASYPSLNPKEAERLRLRREQLMRQMKDSPKSERQYFMAAIDKIDKQLRR